MKIEEMIEVLQAAQRGERIEYFSDGVGKWIEASSPDWNFFTTNFRVAPKPEPKLEKHWQALFKQGGGALLSHNLYRCEDHARMVSEKNFIRLATEYPPIMLPVED